MVNLSQYENEDALDLLADMMEPMGIIMGDQTFVKKWQSGKPIMYALSYAMKKHKQAVIQLIAAIHREDPKEYKFNIPSLLRDLTELVSDPVFQTFFPTQGQTDSSITSGSVTANTMDESE